MAADTFNIEDFKTILGNDIPDALKAIHKMEKNVGPLLAKVNNHRDEIMKLPNGAELLRSYDEQMKLMKEHKAKMNKFK